MGPHGECHRRISEARIKNLTEGGSGRIEILEAEVSFVEFVKVIPRQQCADGLQHGRLGRRCGWDNRC